MKFSTEKPITEITAGIQSKRTYVNISSEKLISQTISLHQGSLSDTGALCVNTGKFTGRSPKDKFIVHEEETAKTIDWGDINHPISPVYFEKLYQKILNYYLDKTIWVTDVYACSHPAYRMPVQIVTETPWASLFCKNLFIPGIGITNSTHDGWQILHAPGFLAQPQEDGTRAENFTIICFSRRKILIGGTAYTGEIKKSVFSVLNYLLPLKNHVLPMHCSANEGEKGDVALFFGLSGTGKTTLSAGADRKLIGDDEHGWSDDAIFNFEGGCYAKCVNLSPEKEPEIFNAIRHRTIVENTRFFAGTSTINFQDISITENTRAAYPIHFISNAKTRSIGQLPKNIFFLTCDAFGVLPPIAKLNRAQTMFHFISGYTAKVAGTEVGITEPQSVFSACFGKAFLPLHPTLYAELLGEKLAQNPDINVWLVNTGWIGGSYGSGERISLKYTRSLIQAAMNSELANTEYFRDPIFNLQVPTICKNVPSSILNPRESWEDKALYDKTALKLSTLFNKNFEQFAEKAGSEILSALPSLAL